ncbi:MAG TPA: hypothetical protein VKK06_08525 [Terriglobia bacterium]|nr:hypothetical protein [Terriglobia bacterium]
MTARNNNEPGRGKPWLIALRDARRLSPPEEVGKFDPDRKPRAKFFNQTDFTFMLEKAREP